MYVFMEGYLGVFSEGIRRSEGGPKVTALKIIGVQREHLRHSDREPEVLRRKA